MENERQIDGGSHRNNYCKHGQRSKSTGRREPPITEIDYEGMKKSGVFSEKMGRNN